MIGAGGRNRPSPTPPPKPMTTFFTFGLLPLFLVIAVIAWATETREQRIRRFVSSGLSQRAVAKRLNVSRYAVSKALAAA